MFLGEPLGVAGTAVAMRQARALGLVPPFAMRVHDVVFRLWVSADVLSAYAAQSPTLGRLLGGEAAVDNEVVRT